MDSTYKRTLRGTLGRIPSYTFEVVHSLPHDPDAYTEGLVFHEGTLYESTGGINSSSVRKVDYRTGQVGQRVDVANEYCEGMTVLHRKLFQLTWKAHRGFIYDAQSLRLEGTFPYEDSGWGLTTDGELLILSDGTNRLRFIDPVRFKLRKVLFIYDEDDHPLDGLNELEYIDGEIFSNVHTTNLILRISATSGSVVGIVDLTGLAPTQESTTPIGYLNGIAHKKGHDRLFVTGKNWPTLFEIRLRQEGHELKQ